MMTNLFISRSLETIRINYESSDGYFAVDDQIVDFSASILYSIHKLPSAVIFPTILEEGGRL